VAGALIAFNAFNKSRARGMLNFYPAGLKDIKFSGVTPIATLGIVVQNPSSQYFTIRSLSGNLFANNILIGNVSNFGTTIIPANAQIVYYVNIRLSILGIVNEVIRSFKKESGFTQNLELQGYANVNNWPVPLRLQYKVGGQNR
jgi:LEA14-like dessication related protein